MPARNRDLGCLLRQVDQASLSSNAHHPVQILQKVSSPYTATRPAMCSAQAAAGRALRQARQYSKHQRHYHQHQTLSKAHSEEAASSSLVHRTVPAQLVSNSPFSSLRLCRQRHLQTHVDSRMQARVRTWHKNCSNILRTTISRWSPSTFYPTKQ